VTGESAGWSSNEEPAMHAVLTGFAVAAIVAYVIGRQLVGEPLRGKRLIVLPVVLAVIGAADLHSVHRPVRSADIVCLVLSGAIVAAIGLAQGRIMRLESRDGTLWAQLPVRGLWLWLALLGSRLAMTAVALGLHAHVAASSSTILLILGINRLSQAAVVAPRAFAAGIPFAPEKDGQTFLAGMFGGAVTSAASPRSREAIRVGKP
jgi:hypothetical protein